jgi:hypothetical protein
MTALSSDVVAAINYQQPWCLFFSQVPFKLSTGIMSIMPEQPHIIKYCDQQRMQPSPRHLVPIVRIESMAANAEKQASLDLAFETQQQPRSQPQTKPDEPLQRKRKDSAAPSLCCGSPISEQYEHGAGDEVALLSPKHVPEHFSDSGLLEAGFNQAISHRNSNWRRFFCKP